MTPFGTLHSVTINPSSKMKKQALLLALLLPLGSFAQISSDTRQQTLLGAGKINVGVNASRGYGTGAAFSSQVSPRLQYFVRDAWSVALEGQFAMSYATQDKYTGAGLASRYYFLRSKRFALFSEAGAMFGQNKSYLESFNMLGSGGRTIEKTSVLQIQAGLGVHYRLSERWSLETGVTRVLGSKPTIGSVSSQDPWRVGVGVNFRLK